MWTQWKKMGRWRETRAQGERLIEKGKTERNEGEREAGVLGGTVLPPKIRPSPNSSHPLTPYVHACDLFGDKGLCRHNYVKVT